MIRKTPQGWTADYYAWGRRNRRAFATKEEAALNQAEEKRESRASKTNEKIATIEYRNLRCAQARKDGSRCRCEATETHTKNGKPTCETHQARN